MKNKLLTRFFYAAAVLSALSACSSIKEAFPDKEKDYQFTTEIPKLTVPADLAKGTNLSSVASPAKPQSAEATANTTETATKPSETETKPAENAAPTESASDDLPATIDPKSITAELQESSNHINYLRINTPFLTAWRVVSKALSRKSIEVNERNQTDKVFTVQYDPDEKAVEDGTYMNEINFMLHGFQGNEKEYFLKLVENNQQTDVVVLNEEQKPTTDEGGLKLLKVLQQSIKANLAGK
ncbi:MAG: outer membrane protein assembly factor BamC [Methylococcales bacterium]